MEIPDLGDLALAVLFFGVASVAQLRPIYVAQNTKATGEDVATFAAALTLDPFLSGVVAAASTLVMLRTSPREPLALRLFRESPKTRRDQPTAVGCSSFSSFCSSLRSPASRSLTRSRSLSSSSTLAAIFDFANAFSLMPCTIA